MVVTAQHFKGVHQIQATNLVVAAGMQTAQSSEAQASLQFAPDSDHWFCCDFGRSISCFLTRRILCSPNVKAEGSHFASAVILTDGSVVT